MEDKFACRVIELPLLCSPLTLPPCLSSPSLPPRSHLSLPPATHSRGLWCRDHKGGLNLGPLGGTPCKTPRPGHAPCVMSIPSTPDSLEPRSLARLIHLVMTASHWNHSQLDNIGVWVMSPARAEGVKREPEVGGGELVVIPVIPSPTPVPYDAALP